MATSTRAAVLTGEARPGGIDAELRAPGPVGMAAVVVAVVLAVASAGLSIYWAVDGATLLDTMGGSTERWGRDGGVLATVALVGWAAVKLAIAAATVVATRTLTDRQPSRWVRAVAWLAAVQVTLYGGLLTIGGLLVETGLISPPDTADRHAITWHALLWDPWTALWGLALTVALWSTRPRRAAQGQPAWGMSTHSE